MTTTPGDEGDQGALFSHGQGDVFARGASAGPPGASGASAGPPAPSGRRLVVETDGGSRGNPGHAGYGAVVREAGTGRVLAEWAGYLGIATNNVAEYMAVVNGLLASAELDPGATVEVRADSKLVVEQMSGRWKIKHADLRALAEQARAAFDPARVRYTWVPREQNTAADALANAVMDSHGQIRRNHDRPTAALRAVPGEVGVPWDVPAPASVRGPAHDAGPTADDAPATAAGAQVVAGNAQTTEEVVAARTNAPRMSGTPLPRMGGEPATVVLVRHGVTELTETGRYSGGDTPGPALSVQGRAQAERAAILVGRVGVDVWTDVPVPTAVVASPMVRTQETGAAVARSLGLPVVSDDRFAECRFGQWDGLTVPEIEAGWPGQVLDWATTADVRPPGGESLRDVGARVARGLRAVAARHQGATVVLAAHTVVIRAAVGLVGRLAPGHWSAVRIPPASLTIVRVWPRPDVDGRLVGDLTVVGCPSELVA
ncbi:bifunctional RNase H/acid phosphatase [Georgenia yuyongxinii]|uniref:bifunctional RNase H/acid phosphatase n=1 Tax=Georgenia yuyongxinii TaxID=2589797 RepID=UPI001E2E287C|nr:bifunctional RNase H/acid phosphatase [Georgenia yuyongxinii]